MKQQQTKLPDAPEKLMKVSDLPPMKDDLYQNEPVFDFAKKVVANNPLKKIMENPITSALFIGCSTYVILYGGGYLLRAAAFFVGGWKELKNVSNKPTGSPPVSPKSS
jgi:hypothetical protein